ncbi:MAG: ferrous iron transport protein B [Deltaproteobacteria bacterium]|nr:MAG: ferrous iron transport protein B [Deltaproteobacteria bacterium]
MAQGQLQIQGSSDFSVALAGNPNSGKTTLFNVLTGAKAQTGNYPGITVDMIQGLAKLKSGAVAKVLDIPGTYSLTARSAEEQVAVEALLPAGDKPDLVIVVADATALERHLYLALQIVETGLPVVIALNMMDEARALGMKINTARLGELLGAEVVPIVASRAEGIDALGEAIERRLGSLGACPRPEEVPESLVEDVLEVERALRSEGPTAAGDEATGGRADAMVRARALWGILSLGDDELAHIDTSLREAVAAVRNRAEAGGRDLDLEIIGARYARIDKIVRESVQAHARERRWTTQIDAVLTHPVGGFVVFAVVMAGLFQALFAWSDPMIGLVEDLVVVTQGAVGALLSEGPVRGLLVDGVIAGVGNVLVFVPQIALLFIFIAFLEDSGYLARVAFVIDRVMSGVGLHGKAFVPLLSGFACAVPAVMATRTIESRRDRLVTMLSLPLMSCSARLPVYVLIIATVFPPDATVLGAMSLGAVVLFGLYALSVVSTLGVAAILHRTVLAGPRPPLVLEMPPYRLPTLRSVLGAAYRRVKSFIVDAGTIILAMTIVLWALLTYPHDAGVEHRFDTLRAEASGALSGDALSERMDTLDSGESEALLRASAAGRLGRFIEPAIEPLGFDWKIGVGIIGSFAAREVLISTLGVVYGIGGDADEESLPLRDALHSASRPDGSPTFTPLMGVSLMVFFLFAAQCMSTLAVVRREAGGWKWVAFMFTYMTGLAYLSSLVVYQGGLLLGFT